MDIRKNAEIIKDQLAFASQFSQERYFELTW